MGSYIDEAYTLNEILASGYDFKKVYIKEIEISFMEAVAFEPHLSIKMASAYFDDAEYKIFDDCRIGGLISEVFPILIEILKDSGNKFADIVCLHDLKGSMISVVYRHSNPYEVLGIGSCSGINDHYIFLDDLITITKRNLIENIKTCIQYNDDGSLHIPDKKYSKE